MKIAKQALLAISILVLASCSSPSEKKAEYPMFWTWLDYQPAMNLDSVCNVLVETGIDGLILNASSPDEYREAIPIAHKYNIKVYAWLWTMNLEHDRDKIIKEHPDWFSYNRKGESLADHKAYVDYYKFMSPALPQVREYLKNKVKAYCEVEGLDGISIDYHRFVDVILPTTLWPKYGIEQDREYAEWDYGYHPEMIRLFTEKFGYDPSKLEDPSTDEKWLQFRLDQITEVANEIAGVVHAHGKKMAASPFPTPSMARSMVRQDWGKWDLDIVFPMVYHNFYTGDISFIEDCTLDNVKQKKATTALYTGLLATSGAEMVNSMKAALENGSEGIAIFTVSSLRNPNDRASFKKYADSMRVVRSESTNFPKVQKDKKPNLDPFANKAIMEALNVRLKAHLSLINAKKSAELKSVNWEIYNWPIKQAMQVNTPESYIKRLSMPIKWGGEPDKVMATLAERFNLDYKNIKLKLSPFELADEYGTTKVYHITDENSGQEFEVKFYFYGGILSGWNATPIG